MRYSTHLCLSRVLLREDLEVKYDPLYQLLRETTHFTVAFECSEVNSTLLTSWRAIVLGWKTCSNARFVRICLPARFTNARVVISHAMSATASFKGLSCAQCAGTQCLPLPFGTGQQRRWLLLTLLIYIKVCCLIFPSFIVIQAIQSLVLPCKYSDGGCKFVGAGAVVKKHEDRCSFRKFECPRVDCEANLIIAEVVDHVKDVHRGDMLTNLKGSLFVSWSLGYSDEDMFLSEMRWPPSMTNFDGHTFILNAYVKDHNWNVWAVVIGDKKIAQKYEVSIRTNSKSIGNQRSARVAIWGDVYSLDISAEEVLDDWKGVLHFNKNMARKMVTGIDGRRGRRGITVKYDLRRK